LLNVRLAFDLADDSAGQRGCGIAFRDHIDRGRYPTSKARHALLEREIVAAHERWSTRYLPDTSPPPSPIRPAPKILPGTPSKSILKKRASTGDIRSARPDIGPVSHMQGYIDGLDAFQVAYDAERKLREERYRAEGHYDEVPRITTVTDSTIRPGAELEQPAHPDPTQEGRPTRSEQARPGSSRPPTRPLPSRPASAQATSSRPYASTSQLDDDPITRASRHRGQARASETLSPLEPTPALSDASLPSTHGIQSPDDFIIVLPRRRRPKSASARRPVPADDPPPDDPETTRSYQDDAPNDDLNHFVNNFVASLEADADAADTDLINPSNPPSPVLPPCADPVTPPRPGTFLDVSAPSTVLPINFSHLPITVDHDPPIFGTMWPFDHRYPVKLYEAISREANAILSRHTYMKSVKSLDNLRARNAQKQMFKAGGPLAMDTASHEQVFVFPKPTVPSGEVEKETSMEGVLGLLDTTAEGAALALEDMDTEQRRIAKGKDKEVTAEQLAWMKSVVHETRDEEVVNGRRDEEVAQKENVPPKGVEQGKEVDPAVNLARMVYLMKRLKGKEVAQKNKRPFRPIRPKGSENIPIKGESSEVKKEILDIGKGKEKVGKRGISEVKSENAQPKPVTPPKPKFEGPSSIRSTRSTLSLRSIRSTTKAARLSSAETFTGPTPGYTFPDKMSAPTASWTSHSYGDSQLRLGSTPSIPQATARVLNFDDTPDHSVVYTPFTNSAIIETPDEGTPTHRRAMKSKLRNKKRASEEELQIETKRVKDTMELRRKVSGNLEAWSAGKTLEGGKDEVLVVKGEEDVFGNGGE
jgi:hypothetical protein